MTTDSKKDTANITIIADTRPLELFIKLLQTIAQLPESRLVNGDFPFELARIETDYSATSAGKLTVILYPSDAFLCFAVTLCAGNFNL